MRTNYAREDLGAMPSANTRLLDQNELASRWGLSPRTIEKWRWIGRGPAFIKLGRLVRYPLESVEEYETVRLQTCTRGENKNPSA